MMVKNASRPFRAALLLALLPALLSSASVELKRNGDQLDVLVGGKLFTTYFFGPAVAKSYLMPLQTPSGRLLSRPFPVGNDASHGDPKAPSFEPHQRPLYFAHGNVDGLNFWAEPAFEKYYGGHSRQAYGHTLNPKIEEVKSGPDSGSVRATFSLADPKGRIIGSEVQQFTFRGDERTRIIDCEFQLKASDGPITLGDTKEGTFGIRLGPELSAPFGRMTNSKGAQGEKEIWGKPADWVNYTGTVNGQPVGIVVFEHPKSFRHPTTWHARAYGLLAANPFGLRAFTAEPQKDGSWTIPEGTSLTFRYRVMLYDGTLAASDLAHSYAEYASLP